jgi:hypothetical protein
MYLDEKGDLKDRIDLEDSKKGVMFAESDSVTGVDIGGDRTDRTIEKRYEVMWRYRIKELKLRILCFVVVGLLLLLIVSLVGCARTTTLHVRGAQIDSLHYQQEVVIRNK